MTHGRINQDTCRKCGEYLTGHKYHYGAECVTCHGVISISINASLGIDQHFTYCQTLIDHLQFQETTQDILDKIGISTTIVTPPWWAHIE